MKDSIYNIGNDYPQLIIRKSIKPKPEVNVTISLNGNILNISAIGNIEIISNYFVCIYTNNILERKISIPANTETFNLDSIGNELLIKHYDIEVIPAKLDGTIITSSNKINWYNTVPVPICESMTLRFKFSKMDFSPVDEENNTQITTKGTWKKIDYIEENIWDWTYEDSNWSNTFNNVFIDENNIVDIINAGDTSGVTNCKSMFKAYLNDRNVKSYIRNIYLFDTSNVTNMNGMFYACTILKTIPKFNTSKVTDMSSMFRECVSLETVPLLDTSNVTNMNGMLYECHTITTVPLYNTSKVTDMGKMFTNDINLVEVPVFDMSAVTNADNFLCGCTSLEHVPCFDISNCTNLNQFINMCPNLKEIPQFNTSSAKKMYAMLNGLTSITSVPKLDYSNATDIKMLLGVYDSAKAPQNLERLPDMSTVTNKITTCEGAFMNIRNVKYGILDAYNILKECNPTTITDCFLNCGIDTAEGLEQLNQIPKEWGGNLDTSNIIGGRLYKTVKIGNQEWMAENLDYKLPELKIGTDIWSDRYPVANYYNNDENTYGETGNKCGLLYNWVCVYEYLIRNKDRVIPGWHVPSKSEWETLIATLGGSSVAGKKLKSTTLWQNGGQGDGSTEFNALPAGMRNNKFAYVGYNSFTKFWTSDTYEDYDIDEFVAWTVHLSERDNIAMDSWEKKYQFSVRLVKDSE